MFSKTTKPHLLHFFCFVFNFGTFFFLCLSELFLRWQYQLNNILALQPAGCHENMFVLKPPLLPGQEKFVLPR